MAFVTKNVLGRSAFFINTRLPITAHLSTKNTNTDENKKFSRLTKNQKEELASMLRVNQAGELAANAIYKGQILVLGSNPSTKKLLKHMLEQEKVHLKVFDELISNNHVRPSALRSLWYSAGFALGAVTALISKEAAMTCTEAVETTIGHHYNEQIRKLVNMPPSQVERLIKIIETFRDEELEHLHIAVENDSKISSFHDVIKFIISTGCKAAICVAKRV